MKRYTLEFTVFVCGMMVMVLELVGSRLIAPFLGTSLIVWTSLIGIVLGSLSLGYWVGGKLADRDPSLARLAAIVAAAAGTILAMALYKDGLLTVISESSLDLRLQTFLAALALFVVPSTLLGMVSPYAAKLRITNLKSTGSAVGNLAALSTLGSIVGTFLTGFVLLAYIGTTNILVLISAILILTALLLATSQFIFPLLLIPLIIGTSTFQTNLVNAQTNDGVVELETDYNHVRIVDGIDRVTGQRIRLLRLSIESSSAMYLDNDSLVFPYTKRYALADYFVPDQKRVLMIGGAAYSYPKHFLTTHPNIPLDVVEIDPAMTDIARVFFKLKDSPMLTIFHEDARTYLNKNEVKYDAILGDAYTSIYSMPFHLTTREAAVRIKESLTERGVYIVNVIGSLHGPRSQFMESEYLTLASVFPQVYVFPVGGIAVNPDQMQNVMMVALPYTEEPNFETSNPELSEYLLERWPVTFSGKGPILTDDYAPVDSLILPQVTAR